MNCLSHSPLINSCLFQTTIRITHCKDKKGPLLDRGFQWGAQNQKDFGERTGQEWWDNSRRVRTHEKNSGDAVRQLSTIIDRLTAPGSPRISRQEQSCAYLRFFRGLASALFFIVSRKLEKLVPFSGDSPFPKVLATTNKRLSWESWPWL